MKKLTTVLLSLAFLFSASCSHYSFCGCGPDEKPKEEKDRKVNAETIPITILHTNDVHGHLWPMKRKDGLVRGGVAAMAALVSNIRQETEAKGGFVLLLSAGDVNTGTPESDYFFAEPDFRAMDAMAFDVMVLGNHEFDNGIDKIALQKSWIKFPLISANVEIRKGKSLVSPYEILNRKGVRIGVLGLTTDSLKSLTLKEHTGKLYVGDSIGAAKKYAPEIRKKSDFMLALTHMGISKSDKKRAVIVKNDDVKLAEANLGFPLIVGGHSHTLLENGMKVGKTLLVQAGEKGEYLGRVDIAWNPTSKTIESMEPSVIRINPEEGESSEIKTILAPFEEKAKVKFDEVVGRAALDLNGETEKVRSGETNLGNLICDVVKEAAGTDIAVFNGGGIRGSIAEGPIRLRDVYRVFPFKNTVVKASFTGKQFRKLLDSAIGSRKRAGGSFLHVSSGVKYTVKDGVVDKILLQDKPLLPDQRITVSTNNFVMSGGDNLDIEVSAKGITDLKILVSDALISYLKQFRSVSPQIEGRVVFEGSPS